MRRYIISKYLIATVVGTVSMTLCASWIGHDGAAQLNDATRDDVLTVEQCINDNADTSIKPLDEKALIKADIIEVKLSNMMVTKEVCREIITRTPDGSPVERIIMTGNVTQEINVIQKSMKDAVEGNVNGDGRINAEDSRTVSASSYAASHAAQRAVRMTVEENVNDTGVIEDVNVETAAYLQYLDGGGGAGGGGESSAKLSFYEKVQDKAKDAAEREGASPKAAAAGGNCAADVALADHTYLEIVRGNLVFEAPAKEMLWKDRDVTELVMSPSALASIEKLKQQLEEAEESKEIKGQCIGLAEKMPAEYISSISSDSAFTITTFGSSVQDIALREGTQWKREIVASNEGTHHPTLFIEMLSTQGEEARAVVPAPFDDDVIVRATLWQKSRRFVGDNWQFFLAPFLAPVAFYLWRKYKQRSNEHEEEGYI